MQQKNRKKDAVVTSKVKGSQSNWKLLLLVASIALISFLSLSPVIKNSYINQDDNVYIFENTNLGKPFSQAIGYFFGVHFFSGNYVPMTMMVYTLEYHLWEFKPESYHTVSLFIHALNVMLVFAFIYLLSRRKVIVAALVALFFGIHPMHVESVAWAAELKDMLYAFFFIAGLIVYYKYLEQKNPGLAIDGVEGSQVNEQKHAEKRSLLMLSLCFVLFIFAILSKPAAVILPVVLLSVDFYTRRKFDRSVWMEKLPFFIVSIFFGIVAIKAQQSDGLINEKYPFYQKLFIASYAFIAYIVKLFLPANLSNFYPYPVAGGHLLPIVYMAPLAVIVLGYFVYRASQLSRVVAFGMLFCLLNTILVLQLVSVGSAVIADRYTYVPYIGLFFIIAMGVDWLYYSTSPRLKNYKYVAMAIVGICAITCSYVSYARCMVWGNEETLAADALDKFPDDPILLNNKGYLLLLKKQPEQSRSFFTRSIQNKRDYTMPYINLMNSYLTLGDYTGGMNVIDSALKYCPGDNNVLAAKGYILGSQQRYSEAAGFYKRALKIRKENIDAYISLAGCYFEMHDTDGWIRTLDTGLKYAPENHVLLNNKGYSLYTRGKYTEAVKYLKASLDKKPDFETASINLRDCYRAMSDSAKNAK